MSKKKVTKKVSNTRKKSPLTELAGRIRKAKRDQEKMREKAIKQGEKLFKDTVKALFKEFPNLESFSWNEYTPHWNDGDACVFSANFESLAINGEEDPEGVWELQSLNNLLSNKDSERARIEKELEDFKSKNKGDDDWEVRNLRDQLKSIEERDPVEVLEKYTMKKTVVELLEDIDSEVYEQMFGEGTVIVRRDGISVEDYEHD
jgi:hypothetical protein